MTSSIPFSSMKETICSPSMRPVITRTDADGSTSSPPYSVATLTKASMPRAPQNSASRRPSVVPPRIHLLLIPVPPRRHHASAHLSGAGISHKHRGKHVHRRLTELSQRQNLHGFPLAPDLAHQAADRLRPLIL